jgi:hypothetical protein
MFACIAVVSAAIFADAAVVNVSPRAGLLRVSNISVAAPTPAGPYGRASCPCVGIDNLEGETTATLKDGSKAKYPKDLGARCNAWDEKNHPKCEGKGEPWCKAKWCYVDPCNCEDVGVLPKTANYFPGAKYQGKPVHFSYATCDAMDSYTEEKSNRGRFEEIEKTCATQVDSSQWGHENCRCVGIGPQPGNVKVDIEGKKADFPADTGSTCKAWEEGNHPECKGASPPSWCSQSWCYVDPCSCKQATPPKTSSYLPDSNYQGKPIYYSYATCGGTDSYTAAEHKTACVNQKTSEECGKHSKCAWDGKTCLGKELVQVCSGAWLPTTIMALALPLLGLIY